MKPFRKTLEQPTIFYVIHGDGTYQTQNLELLNFGMRCLNLGRLARNPAVLQILFLEEHKEHIQIFDAFFNLAMNEGIKAASRNGVHVICLGSSCQLCAGEVTRFKSLAPDGLEKWFHLVKVVFFHVYDIKARTISLPIKNGVCFTCLEMLRSGSYRDSQFEIEAVDSIDLAGPAHAIIAEPVQFTSTANKKRTGNVRLPPPKKAKGKGKATTNVAAVITHDELFKTKDALF